MKIVNKGGGTFRHRGKLVKVEGSDYVIFHCDHCQKRNKASVWDATHESPEGFTFLCNGCCKPNEIPRTQTVSELAGPSTVTPETCPHGT